MDQDGNGKEANNEDIKRVMKTYSSLTDEQIDDFLKKNEDENKKQ